MPPENFFTDQYFKEVLAPARDAVNKKYLEKFNKPEKTKPAYPGKINLNLTQTVPLSQGNDLFAAMISETIRLAWFEQDEVLINQLNKCIALASLRYPEMDIIHNTVMETRNKRQADIDSTYDVNLGRWKNSTRSAEEFAARQHNHARTKWLKLRKGIAKILEKDSLLSHMGPRDAALMYGLATKKILKISEDRVIRIYWDKFEYLPVDDIFDIMNTINEQEEFKFF